MTLVIKVDIEKNKENYQAVADLLAELDIISMAWEDDASETKPRATGKPADLASSVSSAVDRMIERQRGR